MKLIFAFSSLNKMKNFTFAFITTFQIIKSSVFPFILMTFCFAHNAHAEVDSRNFSQKKPSENVHGIGQTKSYININRLQYRIPIGSGESAIQQSSFLKFTNSQFFIVESLDWLTYSEENESLAFRKVNFESTFGRPLFPSHRTGKLLSWVGRVQAGDNQKSVFSAGVSLDLTSSDLLKKTANRMKIRSFIQIYPLKTSLEKNGTDLYYWLQVRGFSRWAYLRGAVGYCFIPDKDDFISLFSDLIVPVNKKFDLYFRYFYQNTANLNKGDDGQFSIGGRYNFTL